MSDVIDIQAIAGDLAGLEPGELYDVGGGRSVRYLVEFDYFTTINDFDDLGTTAPVEPDRYYDCFPHAERPKGFDGSAHILQVGDVAVWWQPPFDWRTLTPETQKSIIDMVYRVLEVGYQVVTVEVCEGADHYGDPIVTGASSYGGVEPWEYGDTSTLAMVLPDLLGEVL